MSLHAGTPLVPITRPGRLATVVLVTLAAMLPVRPTLGAPNSEEVSAACADAEHAALDFWIGSWRLVTGSGQEIATSEITSVQGGCALSETFRAGDVTATGTTYLDLASGTWRQIWLDSLGRVVHYAGMVEGDRARFLGEHIDAGGKSQPAQMTLEKADDRVLFRLELSDDGGASYRVALDGAYVAAQDELREDSRERAKPSKKTRELRETRVDTTAETTAETTVETAAADRDRRVAVPTPSPSTSSSPSPKRGPAPSLGAVEAVSGTADLDTLEAGVAQIQMVSPMTLRLPVGSIHQLGPGYAWTSTDTSPYVCNGASIRRIRLSQEPRGKKVRVDLELALFSDLFSQKVSLEVSLTGPAGGESIASGSLDKVSIGRGTTAQATEGFVTRNLRLEVDREIFDRSFADQSRPDLVITLTNLP